MTGELAQLVERCDRTAEVRGSNPLFSTALLQRRLPLIGLFALVVFSTVARPSALLTFTLLAAAGAISRAPSRRT